MARRRRLGSPPEAHQAKANEALFDAQAAFDAVDAAMGRGDCHGAVRAGIRGQAAIARVYSEMQGTGFRVAGAGVPKAADVMDKLNAQLYRRVLPACVVKRTSQK